MKEFKDMTSDEFIKDWNDEISNGIAKLDSSLEKEAMGGALDILETPVDANKKSANIPLSKQSTCVSNKDKFLIETEISKYGSFDKAHFTIDINLPSTYYSVEEIFDTSVVQNYIHSEIQKWDTVSKMTQDCMPESLRNKVSISAEVMQKAIFEKRNAVENC